MIFIGMNYFLISFRIFIEDIFSNEINEVFKDFNICHVLRKDVAFRKGNIGVSSCDVTYNIAVVVDTTNVNKVCYFVIFNGENSTRSRSDGPESTIETKYTLTVGYMHTALSILGNGVIIVIYIW